MTLVRVECTCDQCVGSQQQVALLVDNEIAPESLCRDGLAKVDCLQELIDFNEMVRAGNRGDFIPGWLRVNDPSYWVMVSLLYQDRKRNYWTLFRTALCHRDVQLCHFLYCRSSSFTLSKKSIPFNPITRLYYLLVGSLIRYPKASSVKVDPAIFVIMYMVDRKPTQGVYELQDEGPLKPFDYMQKFIVVHKKLYDQWLKLSQKKTIKPYFLAAHGARVRLFKHLVLRYANELITWQAKRQQYLHYVKSAMLIQRSWLKYSIVFNNRIELLVDWTRWLSNKPVVEVENIIDALHLLTKLKIRKGALCTARPMFLGSVFKRNAANLVPVSPKDYKMVTQLLSDYRRANGKMQTLFVVLNLHYVALDKIERRCEGLLSDSIRFHYTSAELVDLLTDIVNLRKRTIRASPSPILSAPVKRTLQCFIQRLQRHNTGHQSSHAKLSSQNSGVSIQVRRK